MNHRPLRVGQLIRDELSALLAREVEFGGALVTLTEVEVSKKLDSARVMVSIFPEEKEELAMETLKKKTLTLQFELLRKLNIKPMPQIHFVLDRGPANAAKVEKTLLEDNN